MKITDEKYNTIFFFLENPQLNNQKSIVLEVIRERSEEFEFVDPMLREDKEIAKIAIESHGNNYKYIGESLKSDIELMILAFRNHPLSIKHYYQNPLFVIDNTDILDYIKKYKRLIQYIPLSTKIDKEMASKLMEINCEYIEYLREYKSDPEFIDMAIKDNILNIKKIDTQLLTKNNVSYILKNLKDCPDVLDDIPAHFLESSWFYKKLFTKKNKKLINNLPNELNTIQVLKFAFSVDISYFDLFYLNQKTMQSFIKPSLFLNEKIRKVIEDEEPFSDNFYEKLKTIKLKHNSQYKYFFNNFIKQNYDDKKPSIVMKV